MTSGHFTPGGAARCAARFPARAADGFYRAIPAGGASSLGLGTYLGPPDEAASARYLESMLEAAVRSRITVVASASLQQARLAACLPAETRAKLDGAQMNAQFALPFSRSTPGVSIALAGMNQTAHARENAGFGDFPPAPAGQWLKLFEKEN